MLNFIKSPLVWLVGGVLLSMGIATFYLHGQLQETNTKLTQEKSRADGLANQVVLANSELTKIRDELELQQQVVTERDQRNEVLSDQLTDLQTRLRTLANDSRRTDHEEPNDLTNDSRVPGLPDQCNFYSTRVPSDVVDLMRAAARSATAQGGNPSGPAAAGAGTELHDP